VPFTEATKRIVQDALEESLALGHDAIGPEHLLLALVRDSGGRAARVLADLGADAQRVRERVLSSLGEGSR
jgi:ATP-dependent Clp protease ATP-binding subunit ClpC